jgi:CRISPR-associated protein Csa3
MYMHKTASRFAVLQRQVFIVSYRDTAVRTYISPIGYDTRRVTRPVVYGGISGADRIVLLRPAEESDTERATQAVADVEQLLQEIEPEADCGVERVSTDSFQETVHDCCAVLDRIPDERELVVSLGGGARDVLLPLTVATLVFARRVDHTLFFSDLDGDVRDWSLPDLTAQVPDRTADTLEAIVAAGDWLSLSALAAETGQSKSTVIRHVNDLEAAGVVAADTSEKAKRVRVSFTGELLWTARRIGR